MNGSAGPRTGDQCTVRREEGCHPSVGDAAADANPSPDLAVSRSQSGAVSVRSTVKRQVKLWGGEDEECVSAREIFARASM
jgi:hypothetical protein